MTVPRRYFFCGSFMFLFCLVFAMFCARLFICALWSPAGKGLTSWLSFVVSSVSLSLSHWYPGSGVVLDCIDSWSLQPYYFTYVNHCSVVAPGCLLYAPFICCYHRMTFMYTIVLLLPLDACYMHHSSVATTERVLCTPLFCCCPWIVVVCTLHPLLTQNKFMYTIVLLLSLNACYMHHSNTPRL